MYIVYLYYDYPPPLKKTRAHLWVAVDLADVELCRLYQF